MDALYCIYGLYALWLVENHGRTKKPRPLGSCVASYSQVAFHYQPPEPTEDTPSTCGRLTHLRKQPQQKQTDELLVSIHTCTVSLLMCSYRMAVTSCVNNAPFAKSGHML